MRIYIENLLNNRKCISITYPPDAGYFPETDLYVLFDDGKLILSQDELKILRDLQIRSLKKYYPALEFDIELVPEHYINAIYDQILKTQKSAKNIFIEILKQKTKKLKKMYHIQHHKALEISAKIVGFKNFQDVFKISEAYAKYAIHKENIKKQHALKNNKDYVKGEYEKYLKKA